MPDVDILVVLLAVGYSNRWSSLAGVAVGIGCFVVEKYVQTHRGSDRPNRNEQK